MMCLRRRSIRILLRDINKGTDAQNSLRLEIFKAFREAGIEIPYAQYYVHLRDLDGGRAVIATALEARRREREPLAAE